MSRSAERGPRDAGFSILEVVVALGIFALLVVAVLPQLLGGVVAADVARRSTQAKSLAAAELERMRNLPYHVDPASGPFVDVLDRYYRNTTAPSAAATCTAGGKNVAPTAANVGFVAATSTDRCPWEPAGAFYRQVRTSASDPDLAGYVVVVNTQFLSSATPPTPRAPRAGYDTQVLGRDEPTTPQIGVTVNVLRDTPSARRPATTYTQIARTFSSSTRVRATGSATALTVSTFTPDSVTAMVSAGLVNLDATVAATSLANAVLAGASASTGTGARGGSGILAVTAPPTVSTSVADGTDGSLDASGCLLVCWGGTRLSSPVSVTAEGGLPNLGSPANALSAAVKEPSAGGQTLRVAAGDEAVYRTTLALAPPLVRVKEGTVGSETSSACAVGSGGTGVRLAGSGWVRTTDAAAAADPLTVDVCTTARSTAVSVLPTTFAPDGVVRIRLPQAAVRCQVSGSSHTATTSVDFEARIERWTGPGGNDYATVATVTEDSATDVLAGLDLDQVQVGDRGPLSQWIDSWSNATSGAVVRSAVGGEARVKVPAVVNLVTQPLRFRSTDGVADLDAAGDPVVDELSTMSVTLGSLSCLARDDR